MVHRCVARVTACSLVALGGILGPVSLASAEPTPTSSAAQLRSASAVDPLAGLAADTLAALVEVNQATLSRPGVPDGGASFASATAGDPDSPLSLYAHDRQALAGAIAQRSTTATAAELETTWAVTTRDRLVVVLSALAQLGTPYRFAAASPGGFDCSGLVQWAWSRVGVALPRTAHAQISSVRPRQPDTLLPADLTYHVEHVSMYLGAGRLVVDSPYEGHPVEVIDYWKQEPRFGDPLG